MLGTVPASHLQPFATLSHTVKATALDGSLADVYKCFFVDPKEHPEDICSPNYADATGEQLFQYAVKELRSDYASAPAGKYLLPMYYFNDGTNGQQGLLGVAYDDGETGTQSFVYSFLTPDLNAAGFGFTDTAVHEAGHHMNLSHPHDGYDSEEDTSYGPGGKFCFANLGDESNSVMSYMSIQPEFSQFNLDSPTQQTWSSAKAAQLQQGLLDALTPAQIAVLERQRAALERYAQTMLSRARLPTQDGPVNLLLARYGLMVAGGLSARRQSRTGCAPDQSIRG